MYNYYLCALMISRFLLWNKITYRYILYEIMEYNSVFLLSLFHFGNIIDKNKNSPHFSRKLYRFVITFLHCFIYKLFL